jgi:hypothetical protein
MPRHDLVNPNIVLSNRVSFFDLTNVRSRIQFCTDKTQMHQSVIICKGHYEIVAHLDMLTLITEVKYSTFILSSNPLLSSWDK